jgi:hypothetical protein
MSTNKPPCEVIVTESGIHLRYNFGIKNNLPPSVAFSEL